MFSILKTVCGIAQKIKFLETENEKLKKSLKDCEEALHMANGETDKSNKVARDAKAKISEVEARVKELEGEVQAAGAKAADLELQLKEAEEKFAEAEKRMKEHQSKLGQVQQTNVKFEKDLEGVHTGLQDREMKMEDLKQALAEKQAELEKKEAQVADLTEKVSLHIYLSFTLQLITLQLLNILKFRATVASIYFVRVIIWVFLFISSL